MKYKDDFVAKHAAGMLGVECDSDGIPRNLEGKVLPACMVYGKERLCRSKKTSCISCWNKEILE